MAAGQKQRAAAARAKLIQAVVEVVSEGGYSAATATAIARRAGVSTGNLFSFYKTLSDLRMAALSFLYDVHRAAYERACEGRPSVYDRVIAAADAAERLYSTPHGQALTHILAEGPLDPAMRDQLPGLVQQLDETLGSVVFGADAIAIPSAFELALRTYVASLRGLALLGPSAAAGTGVSEELRLLRSWLERATAEIDQSTGRCDDRPRASGTTVRSSARPRKAWIPGSP